MFKIIENCGERMEQALAGLKVLDFGRYIAAPWCAAILADLGAEVIRVERLEGGEDRWVTPLSETGDGAMFLQCNRNKYSMTLNPQTPEGAEVKRRLVAEADVVIVNLPEAALIALGLDYDTLRAIKPDLIFVLGTAYGTGGPYSDRLGYDGIGQVMSGAMFRSGTPEQPMRCAVPYADYGTAMCLASGTMAALFHRQKTGKGQKVEGGLLSTALMMSNAIVMEQAVLQVDRPAAGNRGYAGAPSDLYRTSDGWVLVQIVGQAQFKRWCRIIGEDHWLTDPRFADDNLRGLNNGVINDRMAEWCKDRTEDEIIATLAEGKIPACGMYNLQDVLEDEHIEKMGYYHYEDYPGLPRPAPIMETPFRLSETPASIRSRAPTIGEHTDMILGQLGYSEAEILDLRDKKAV
jgi:crotonobetainyl-CoA:carnitine CoA-transferase CaiB-like acyl-CoA transferase